MNAPAKLQHRPFLAPLALLALTVMSGVLILIVASWVLVTDNSTTVIVVRHAEKATEGTDPPLTAEGEARAEMLARMFGDKRLKDHVDAIYVSPALRNRQTAEPLAARLGVTPTVASKADPSRLARRMLHEHPGARILVVGHVDTVPAIVAALSGVRDLPSIGASEYGTMYIVTVPRIGRASILSMSY